MVIIIFKIYNFFIEFIYFMVNNLSSKNINKIDVKTIK